MAVFNSIQEGSLSSWTGNNTTVTISAVDTTKAFVKISYRIDSADPQYYLVNCQIENSTTIRIKRYASGVAITIFWQVIEFTSGVSVQRGVRYMNSATENITISYVDLSKSFPIITWLNLGSQFSTEDAMQAYISSSTNLELKAYGAGSTVEVQWQVIEYDNASVQVVHDHIVNSDNTYATISAVNLDKTFYVGSWGTTLAPTGVHNMPSWFLTSTTSLHFYRFDPSTNVVRATVYIVTTDDINVQRGRFPINAGNYSNDHVLTSVDLSRTLLIGGSMHCTWGTANNGDDHAAEAAFTFEKISSSLVRMTRAQNWNNSLVLSLVVEWLDVPPDSDIFKTFQRGIQRGINRGTN